MCIVLFCMYVCMHGTHDLYNSYIHNINVHNKVHFVIFCIIMIVYIIRIHVANYTLTVSNGWHPMTPTMPE